MNPQYYVLTQSTKTLFNSHKEAWAYYCEINKPISGVFKVMDKGAGAGPINVSGWTRDFDAARALTDAHNLKHHVILRISNNENNLHRQ